MLPKKYCYKPDYPVFSHFSFRFLLKHHAISLPEHKYTRQKNTFCDTAL
jgi:hypothetical protein